ncbi:oviduct-specific glycoprotein [Diaporthe helianthi]|uniref:chitinase n=1 Tax=Diaporthe helianthi TaxID=158607 RepID=A0A2P5HLK2_DIAHE|nr:oviduct-specific glycoprotein [Diaporthe helianthi]
MAGNNEDLSWRDAIIFSPGHQNPAKAPAMPIPNIDGELEDSAITYNNSMSAFNPRGLNTLLRRDALRCDDGPCADDSCCGKDGICGYGLEYCGDGCTSQCDATAMCGEFSEDADVPCVLFYSFAFIDPVSFKIVPAHADDEDMMQELTGLSKDGKLQTWIAIGGFDFGNPEVETHTMANRKAFIDSVAEFMEHYGFQGVDLDWEYPGDPKRGGKKLADTSNFAQLLREMRASYGDRYGISLTLAPDYWYLRWFDAKAMEPYVDFFGFMTYDLHGSWDSDFDGLDPKKINFGLAMYGRGYTLADPSCNSLGCHFLGPSKPAECINSPGVMSLAEIKRRAKELNVQPEYLPDSMMKQLTWDDQWIGYDDEETFAKKKEFADSMCFGGTMVWSIDFQEQPDDIGSGEIEIELPNKGQTGGGNGGGQGATITISDPQGTPFTGFDGCTLTDKNHLLRAWWDVVELSRVPSSSQVFNPAGELEQRIWGQDIAQRDDAIDLIHKSEQVYCKKDTITSNKPIGGYAFSTGPTYEEGTIVMCPPFFAPGQEHLLAIKINLDGHPAQQHSPIVMTGKAHMLLHELSHLSSIQGESEVIIHDQVFNEQAIRTEKVYGIYWVQRMAGRFKQRARTHLNADTYAWYASLKFFEGLYGIPDAYVAPRGDEDEDDGEEESGPTKALNIILENSRHGVPPAEDFYDRMKWLFFSVPYGTDSQCKDDPMPVAEALADKTLTQIRKPQFPHGTFEVKTQDGMCEYKNDGQGNPGALWCDGTAHSCTAQVDMAGRDFKTTYCDELGDKIVGSVEQLAVVVCEW